MNGPQSIWHYKIRGISPVLQKHSVLQKACMNLRQQQSSVTAWCEMDSEPFEPNKTILMTFNVLQFKIKKPKTYYMHVMFTVFQTPAALCAGQKVT